MSALSSPKLSRQPTRSPRSRWADVRHSRPLHRALAIETTAKLAIGAILSGAAIVALVKIVPYHFSQKNELQELQLEVKQTEGRVAQLQREFNHYFDPRQVKAIMQEQSRRVDPTQRQIIWINRSEPRTP